MPRHQDHALASVKDRREWRTESKRDKFIRLGNARTARAMKAVMNIRPLANKGQYEFSDRDAELIVSALDNEVEKLRVAFKNALDGRVVDAGFKLLK